MTKVVFAALFSFMAALHADAAPVALRNGDLIFQESNSSQSAAILAATGSTFTHMGIVTIEGGRPVVIEASGKVRRISLERWLRQGRGGRYAVYRAANLSASDAKRVVRAAERYEGRPYDIFFRFGDDRIYCSELPLLAFRVAGIELGRIETVGELNNAAPHVGALFLKRWRGHPDCAGLKSADACWRVVLRQELITPASIAQDKKLTLVYSDF